VDREEVAEDKLNKVMSNPPTSWGQAQRKMHKGLNVGQQRKRNTETRNFITNVTAKKNKA
jgi:hypothetical protein